MRKEKMCIMCGRKLKEEQNLFCSDCKEKGVFARITAYHKYQKMKQGEDKKC